MKLIDKDALVAEIERRRDRITKGIFSIPLTGSDRAYATFEYEILGKIKDFLDSLKVKEVDLEKEIQDHIRECLDVKFSTTDVELIKKDVAYTAKHFFELGLSVSNSTKVTTPDIDNILKENGVNPYSKEAKIIKESYFMAIEKLTQKGEEHEV